MSSHESKQKQRQMLIPKGSQNSPIMQFISDSDDDDEARR